MDFSIATEQREVSEAIGRIRERFGADNCLARDNDGLTLFHTDLDPSHVSMSAIDKMGRKALDSIVFSIENLDVPLEDWIGKLASVRAYSIRLPSAGSSWRQPSF